MHAKNFFIYECTDRQTVKDVRKNFPEFDRVSAFAFIVEPVDSIDLSAFVISPKQEEVLRVLNLVAKQ